MPELFIVPTPIGNLEDMTFRAVRILKECGLIAAEDTRHTRKLLDHFNIATAVTSLHQHNEHHKAEKILDQMIDENISVAVVSDAGMPGVSDPGFLIVREAIKKQIRVEVLPGASAFLTGLTGSGLPCDRFVFEGFLPAKKGRKTRLEQLSDEVRTMVFYESPHRVAKTVRTFTEFFGSDRPVVIARELSKVHEEYIRGTLSEVSELLEQKNVKGEMVIILAGKS